MKYLCVLLLVGCATLGTSRRNKNYVVRCVMKQVCLEKASKFCHPNKHVGNYAINSNTLCVYCDTHSLVLWKMHSTFVLNFVCK